MSLINDALKRASQAQKEKPPSPQSGAPMTPVIEPAPGPRQPRGASGSPSYIIPVLIALVVLLGGWALWQFARANRNTGSTAQNTTAPQPQPNQGTAPSTATPNVQSTPTPVVNSPLPSTTGRVQVNTNLVVRSTPTTPAPRSSETAAPTASVPSTTAATTPPTATAPPVVTTPPPAAGFPALKVQAIIFRLNNPSALINGKTVGVGDYLDEVKVVKIERTRVTVELNGQTKVLAMP